MARSPRHDEPRTWQHVVNHDLAKRAVFENREGMRWLGVARQFGASSAAVKERCESHRRGIAGGGCCPEQPQETATKYSARLG
jgi:hypothetical protein